MSPDLAHFEKVARATVAGLPDAFRPAASDVVLRIVDWPDAALLADLDMSDPAELTGLYDGIPMTEKSSMDIPLQPDTVWLFREPILQEWRERGDVYLDDLIAHVVIHEFAHHFGWTDDRIAAVDQWWL